MFCGSYYPGYNRHLRELASLEHFLPRLQPASARAIVPRPLTTSVTTAVTTAQFDVYKRVFLLPESLFCPLLL